MRFSDKPRVLWIDAICINQSSLSERSDQVALMSTIYSRANRNLVYLGEDDTAVAERAIENVEILYAEMRVATNNCESVYETLYNPTTDELLGSIEDFEVDVDHTALASLYNLAWFT
jgi:ABC-type antimicrobial peptide transport system ATPase subunit